MMKPDHSYSTTLAFQEAGDARRPEVLRLLESLQLPTADIGEQVALYALLQGDRVLAVGGLECYGSLALLRSVGVDPCSQAQGLGRRMTGELERAARQAGVQVIFLLTTTAEGFFSRQGYSSINREEAPEVIRQTSEFASVCPASAVVMRKRM